MNLLFRLFRIVFAARFLRPKVGVSEETSVRFRAWPTDLDPLWHVNNGKYFSLMDLGRTDLIVRSGLWDVLRANGWYAVIAGETIRFKRSLTLGQRFELRTRMLGWDDRSFYMRQTFLRGETVIAVGLVRARFLSQSNGKTISAAHIVQALAPGASSPPLPSYVKHWRTVEGELHE